MANTRDESKADPKPTIVGRSSSHFTRVTRIFALEAGVEHSFRPIRDLMSTDPSDYAGNPALKLPILETQSGAWFGALNICRELARQSTRKLRIVWPEDFDQTLLGNAQELAVQAMGTEVALIMSGLGAAGGDTPYQEKLRHSLINTVSWLDAKLTAVLAALPAQRDLSYLEVTIFSLVTHLEFRKVLATAGYERLGAFCREFDGRASATETSYRFDA